MDNIQLNLPDTLGQIIATDDIGTVQHQLVKLEFGTDGAATMVSASDPLPITGAVTANAGANLNTSALALEAGNLATIAGKDFATQATLALIKSKTDNIPADPARESGNLATLAGKDFSTSTKQDTGNTSLGSIDTKLTSQATAANQTTGNNSLSSIDAGIPAGLGQTTSANSMPVVLPSDQVVPMSATALPLPANAAQETGGNLATLVAKDFSTESTLQYIRRLNENPARYENENLSGLYGGYSGQR